jgi:hypothetical protein
VTPQNSSLRKVKQCYMLLIILLFALQVSSVLSRSVKFMLREWDCSFDVNFILTENVAEVISTRISRNLTSDLWLLPVLKHYFKEATSIEK